MTCPSRCLWSCSLLRFDSAFPTSWNINPLVSSETRFSSPDSMRVLLRETAHYWTTQTTFEFATGRETRTSGAISISLKLARMRDCDCRHAIWGACSTSFSKLQWRLLLKVNPWTGKRIRFEQWVLHLRRFPSLQDRSSSPSYGMYIVSFGLPWRSLLPDLSTSMKSYRL